MFGKNLVHLRKTHGWTQADLADRLQVARTTLGDYEREKTEPNFETLTHLSEIFKVEIDALITSPLYQQNLSSLDKSEGRFKRFVDPDTGYLQAIDLVETKAEAGYLESFQDPEYIRELPKLYLPLLPKNEYRGFQIEGDSMLPIESGTIIIGVRIESLDSIRDGRTYIIITKRDGMVYKRIKKHHAGTYLLAISDNPVFPPYEIDFGSIAEVWQYYAHIGFSDRLNPDSHSMEDRIEDILQKVTEIHRNQESN